MEQLLRQLLTPGPESATGSPLLHQVPAAVLTAADDAASGMTLAHHCADAGLVGALGLLAPLLEAAGTPPGSLTDGLGRSVLEVASASTITFFVTVSQFVPF